jgi:hypothetical protein
MASNPNPFSKVIDALWTLLEADVNFTDLVKTANRVKYNSETIRDPIKQNVAPADMPEVAIVYSGGPQNLFDTSSSTKLVASFDIIVNTGDYRLTEFAMKLEWIILNNLVQWRTVMAALEWRGENYVKRVTISSNVTGETIAARNRGLKGWTVVKTLDVEMHFKTTNVVFSDYVITQTDWMNAQTTAIITFLGPPPEIQWTWGVNDLVALDNDVSSVALGAGDNSGALVGTNYGFNVPDDATLLGIDARIYAHTLAGDSNIVFAYVSLFGFTVLDPPVLGFIGDNQSDGRAIISGAISPYVFGGENNTWNLSAVSSLPAALSNSQFGMLIKATGQNDGDTVEVDAMQLRLRYRQG